MRVGLGLPAAVPGAEMTALGDWAAAAEQAGFASLGVIDRLVYDNLDPLVALAAAAARTEQVELITTVLSVGWRSNAVVLAKQMASVDLLSGGRFTAGLGLGGWDDDFAASGLPAEARRGLWDSTLASLRETWSGAVSGRGGAILTPRDGRPALLLGGFAAATFRRVAAVAAGWVAPLFGLAALEDGTAKVRAAWAEAGRAGEPRIATGRYVALGDSADQIADAYIHHYYGHAFDEPARADTLTNGSRLHDELAALAAAGATDVVLYPCSADIGQVELVAAALAEARLVPHAERQPSVSGEESALSNVRHAEQGRRKEAS